MAIPQRMTVVTLGAHDMSSLRSFYGAIGWSENSDSDDTFTSFTTGSVRLALYPIELLNEEAAPGESAPNNTWNGTALTINVATREEVDDAIATGVAAGARAIGSPAERDWGGYTGYFADPEGHRWEIAWAPFFTNFE
jgi:hypothetical protein